MKILPEFASKAAIRFCRKHFAEQSVAQRINFPHHGHPVSLHMVVGKEMTLLGMLGLRSLEWHSGYSWAPVIHDDGTMDEVDFEAWKRFFPECTIIPKDRADKEVSSALEPFPACRENRLKHHWFLKVFDTHHYASHEHYIVLDSDILFFRRPQLVLDWIKDPFGTFYVMRDTKEKYSHPKQKIVEAMGIPMMEAVNSGLDMVPKGEFSLEFAEQFLTNCSANATHYEFLEQTIFAIMASRAPNGRHLPSEYEISWNRIRRWNAVCRHYVGSVKKDLFFLEGATSFYLQTLLGPAAVPRRKLSQNGFA